ncbi:MAG TPA: GNAT family N-acetyltransferase [Acidimicrobiia bacterium]|nr:GNAT family N-acetyltransferase [Acidimicrobiia bacterium]
MSEYPAEYEFDVVLRDGSGISIRPIRSDDDHRIVDLFGRLGQESRYFRFFRVKNTLDPEEIRYFTTVDYDDRFALVAVDDDAIIGVGRYDTMEDDPSIAEVAFAVADDHQGRGIGTELLLLLTSYARSHGVKQFRAFVLPENRQMMRVFRNSGFELSRTMEEGIYTVDFPVEESEGTRAAWGERERRAVTASLGPIFVPRSVAVIGASTDPASIGNRLFRNLLRDGFTGPLYPVNPNARVVNSVRAYPTINDIPDDVDLAFIVVPASIVLEVVRQCCEKGVRGIVVISAGFSEGGEEGAARERELVSIVRRAGVRMVGPNCLGLINTDAAVSMNGTFSPVSPPKGNIAMSSQSGALGIAVLDYAREAGIGLSHFVSVGNKADVSGNDLLLAWEEDPTVDVILLYLESFGNPTKFSRIARRIARRKPIVAVKSGRTQAGSRAASSHTGALASSDVAVGALFRQAGVIRVDTIEELFGVGSLLADQPIPGGRRVGIVTNAGGPGILAADALEANGLELPALTDGVQEKMRQELPAEAATSNPVDLIASAGPHEFNHATAVLIESGEVDAVVVIHVEVEVGVSEPVAQALRECQDAHMGDVTLMTVFMGGESAAAFLAGGDEASRTIPTYQFPEQAALALSRAVGYGRWRRRDPGAIPVLQGVEEGKARKVIEPALRRLGDDGGWLEADEVTDMLEAVGLRVPVTKVVESEEAAVAAASEIGRSVLKVISPSALHKSDVGGVVLDVSGDEAVREAYRQVTGAVPDPEGVLVQSFVPAGHEVLIGSTDDPSFGPLIVFGLGGVTVELLGDVAFRIHPLTDADASEMVRSVKGYPLLEGYRNMPEGDVTALEEALLRVSALVSAAPEIVEMDLNPVKVLAPGEGVIVVDARIRVEPLPPGDRPELADLPSVTS